MLAGVLAAGVTLCGAFGAGTARAQFVAGDPLGPSIRADGPPQTRTCDDWPHAPGRRIKVRARVMGAHGRRARRVGPQRPLRIRYGRRVRLRGRVLGANGRPLSGGVLCVMTRRTVEGAGLRERRMSLDARGRFSSVLPRGPSLRVSIVHRGGAATASKRFHLGVPAPLKFRASRRSLANGQSVVLRGRLTGRPRPKGLVVEFQARVGTEWRTFATKRSRRGGRFRKRYRFTRTSGVQVYKLRARMPHQRGHAFDRGVSKSVKVRVVGK